jgi:hypothetical protein
MSIAPELNSEAIAPNGLDYATLQADLAAWKAAA